MKKYIILSLVLLSYSLTYAQSNKLSGRFGFGLTSSYNSELRPLRIIPSVTYKAGKSQFEAGFGFNPFILMEQKILSGDLTYKYFPNGTAKKFSLYLLTRFSYIHDQRETYYPSTYNFLFLNGGYGIEIKASKNVSLGTNMTAGVLTFSKKSEIPYEAFAEQGFFDDLGYNLALQFNIGYRF
ncbi:hypothetical protein [Portibacter lacus]|uniref:Outer membrane protein beta-barrel domain-containing protein n=1 Tax=Portibacter lacus TaxID=1099794 RepID=A0AA37SSB4_9BACT|nr:hypothetical protein [Portibacter lacus]GLR19057.1 hypothetical protein GCM10007940_36730 [Portibacter lacus]